MTAKLSKALSCALVGIDSTLVEVEVNIVYREEGEPTYSTVGLPDTAVRESKDRVRAAICNSGYSFSGKNVTVNLAPATIRKEGSAFDLPIAVGYLFASRDMQDDLLRRFAIVGELSLDGRIRPVRGALSMAAHCKEAGLTGLVLPRENAAEAAIVRGIEIIPVDTLREAVEFLLGNHLIAPFWVDPDEVFRHHDDLDVDFADVKGQEYVRRAMEVAAAGGHNAIMIGPPGAGKTMISKRIATILPEMTFEEAIETTKVHSICGKLDHGRALVAHRPFRAPHHTISDAGLIGGGSIPVPGEVSLAHNGVLFLDEILEFRRNVLEVLRQPLEEGYVTISRAIATLRFPARFMLIAAMNPCPCGYFNDATRICSCTNLQIKRYLSRISGPLLDRIDLHIDVPAMNVHHLTTTAGGESSASIRERVNRARSIQSKRFAGTHIYCNAQMMSKELKKFCKIDDTARSMLESSVERLGLSARAFDRILKVARTIADIEASADIDASHVAEAVNYRTLDKNYFQNEELRSSFE